MDDQKMDGEEVVEETGAEMPAAPMVEGVPMSGDEAEVAEESEEEAAAAE